MKQHMTICLDHEVKTMAKMSMKNVSQTVENFLMQELEMIKGKEDKKNPIETLKLINVRLATALDQATDKIKSLENENIRLRSELDKCRAKRGPNMKRKELTL